jgi:hypothetical protein
LQNILAIIFNRRNQNGTREMGLDEVQRERWYSPASGQGIGQIPRQRAGILSIFNTNNTLKNKTIIVTLSWPSTKI